MDISLLKKMKKNWVIREEKDIFFGAEYIVYNGYYKGKLIRLARADKLRDLILKIAYYTKYGGAYTKSEFFASSDRVGEFRTKRKRNKFSKQGKQVWP